jgi:two-component system, chemotaxis family, protein-glutamate methylesterase/glutaminase
MSGPPSGRAGTPASGPRVPAELTPIRVLVVDDSAAQSGFLRALLDADPRLSVVGIAPNGAAAVRETGRLAPDVITMDLHMPLMDGLEATRQIMAQTPTPILIVTSSASYREQHLVFQAFEAGALAVVAKPAIGQTQDVLARELIRTVKSVAGFKLVRRWGPRRPSEAAREERANARLAGRTRPELVAVGASTGGPQALQELLTRLPADFPWPVVIVQHITPGFAGGLVEWLRSLCPLPIALATDGHGLRGPGIFVAPTGHHLTVRGWALTLTETPPVSGHRPSATVLFQSVAREYGAAAVGVLLTGMGDDGAVGLRDIKRGGGLTIAQDEASSVVFGMPAAAIALGVVDRVLAPGAIASMLGDLAARAGPSSVLERPDAG